MDMRFLPLLLVVVLAFLVPLLLSSFRRVPVVIGEILAGIIIGPSVLKLVNGQEPTLELLAEIGFAFFQTKFTNFHCVGDGGTCQRQSRYLVAHYSTILSIG